jgi:hypothetical protein
LETSTDPAIITAAAEIAADLQWPLDLDLEAPMTRVAETFHPCLDLNFSGISVVWTVREGMTHRALICSKTYFTFRLITQASSITPRTEPYIYFGDIDPIATGQDPSEFGQLLQMAQLERGSFQLGPHTEGSLPIQWVSYIIPSLYPKWMEVVPEERISYFLDQFDAEKIPSMDLSIFANYLYGLSRLFGHMDTRLVAWVDKRFVKTPTTYNFDTQVRCIRQRGRNHPDNQAVQGSTGHHKSHTRTDRPNCHQHG